MDYYNKHIPSRTTRLVFTNHREDLAAAETVRQPGILYVGQLQCVALELRVEVCVHGTAHPLQD